MVGICCWEPNISNRVHEYVGGSLAISTIKAYKLNYVSTLPFPALFQEYQTKCLGMKLHVRLGRFERSPGINPTVFLRHQPLLVI